MLMSTDTLVSLPGGRIMKYPKVSGQSSNWFTPIGIIYYGMHMINPESGIWTIFLTEWCVRVALTLVWDVYDTWRLWCLPSPLLDLLDQLDFHSLVGHRNEL